MCVCVAIYILLRFFSSEIYQFAYLSHWRITTPAMHLEHILSYFELFRTHNLYRMQCTEWLYCWINFSEGNMPAQDIWCCQGDRSHLHFSLCPISGWCAYHYILKMKSHGQHVCECVWYFYRKHLCYKHFHCRHFLLPNWPQGKFAIKD